MILKNKDRNSNVNIQYRTSWPKMAKDTDTSLAKNGQLVGWLLR